jgi:chromosome segregation ATPase
MAASKLVPVLAITLAACTGDIPPVTSPPPFEMHEYPHSEGVTEEQAGTKSDGELKQELAGIDRSLASISRQLQTAEGSAKEDLQQQVATLQSRADELRVQLDANAHATDVQVARAHREIQRGLMILDRDMKKLEDKIAPSSTPRPP